LIIFAVGSSPGRRTKRSSDDPEAAGFSTRRTRKKGGTFEFTRLVPGVYQFRAIDSYGNVGVLRDLTVEAGATPGYRTLTLSAGARVRIRVEGHAEPLLLSSRILQDGLSIRVRDLEDPVTVSPGPATVELLEYDPQSEEWMLLESRDITAIAGEEVVSSSLPT